MNVRKTNYTNKVFKEKQYQALKSISSLNKIQIGFNTRLFNNFIQYCCYEYSDSIQIKRKEEIFTKFYIPLSNNDDILTIPTKKIANIKEFNNILDFSTHDFIFVNQKLNFKKNIFFSLEDQLLRYWSLNPIIRLHFDNNKQLKIFLDDLKIRIPHNKRKNKKNDMIPYILYNNFISELKQFQFKVLEKIEEIHKETKFHLFCLISNNILTEPIDIDFEFLEFLKQETNKSQIKLLKANNILEIFSVSKNKIPSQELLKKFILLYNHDSPKSKSPIENQEYFKIKKVLITPNNIIFHSKSEEFSNRILMKFQTKIDKFLTLTFCDNKYKKLCYSFDNFKGLVQEIIYPVLSQGLTIGKNVYSFLSYSNSQLRSHSVWMFEEDKSKDFTFDLIFQKMGDFTIEKTVSKNASRRGLLFTTAKFFKEIKNVLTIPDKEKKIDEKEFFSNACSGLCVKTYCFTDGVGRISKDLVIEAASLFGMKFASAFQIRFGGYKGVLSVKLDLGEETIELRKSMKKFNSTLKDLYIIRPSFFSQGFLNRQIIVLLVSLGIKDSIILDMQHQHLKRLEKIFDLDFNNDKFDISIFTHSQFVEDLLISIREESKKNPDFQKRIIHDPFIFGICKTIYLSNLEELKNKAKIYDEFSGKFLGIVDEYDILEENQVFIQINKENDFSPDNLKNCQTITGKVIVTKNPCLYQGDIQILEGIDHPILKQSYANVIVFPKKGIRPIQQLISDGDLDGDIYYVSWNPALVKNIRNEKFISMDYLQIEISGLKDENHIIPSEIVEREAIIKFFCSYLENDILGTLCNRHLAYADKEGPESAKCLKLGTFQSNAVNFGKYGHNISYADLKNYNITIWPDYMEKERTYESNHCLGLLYREIKKIYDDYMEKVNNMNLNYKFRYELLYDGFEYFLIFVSELLYEYYYEELHSLLKKYKIKTEFEFILAQQIKFKGNKFGKDHHDSNEMIKLENQKLSKFYKEYFYAIVVETYNYFKQTKFTKSFKSIEEDKLIKKISEILNANYYNQEYFNEKKNEFFLNENEPEFLKIKNAILSALYFLSFNFYALEDGDKEMKKRVENFDLFKKYMQILEKKKYLLFKQYDSDYSKYYDYDSENDKDLFEFDSDEEDIDELNYWGDEYFDDKIFIRSKKNYFNKNFKNYYSLSWLLDPNFMIHKQ